MLLAVATFAPRNNGHVSNPTSPQRVPTRQTKTGRDSNNAAAIQARAQPGMIVHTWLARVIAVSEPVFRHLIGPEPSEPTGGRKQMRLACRRVRPAK